LNSFWMEKTFNPTFWIELYLRAERETE
jgi:hypothetical protein